MYDNSIIKIRRSKNYLIFKMRFNTGKVKYLNGHGCMTFDIKTAFPDMRMFLGMIKHPCSLLCYDVMQN